MKPLTMSLTGVFVGLFVCAPLMLCALVESEDQEKAAIRDWRNVIEAGCDLKTYGEALRKLSRPWTYCDAERLELYEVTRKKVLSLPGHAEYFAELIEKERAALKPGEYRGGYDDLRDMYLTGVLVHLPSPETVKVLGGFLGDERDFAPVRWLRGEAAKNHFEGGAEGGSCANSTHAANGLGGLGLRDPPPEPRYPKYGERKRLWRQWWEQVKSGGRAFSFKGQAVEYRFKPDGTWVSTPIANPPDDAPKPAPPKAPPREHPQPPAASEVPPPAAGPAYLPPWPWLAGGALAILAAAWYFLKSRKARGG